MPRVFIFYSRQDLTFVEKLAADLQAVGLETWWDLSSIQGGDAWQHEIQNALDESQFCIVVLSPDSMLSDWVEREYLYAIELRLKILPLLYRDCKTPLAFKNIEYIDVRKEKYNSRLPEILNVMGVKPQKLPKLKEQSIIADEPPVHGGLPARVISNATEQRHVHSETPNVKAVVSKAIEAGLIMQEKAPVIPRNALRSEKATPSGDQNRRTIGGIEFVRVPAGEFVMGSKEDNELANDNEMPQHTVEITYDYWLAKFILTNEQYAEYLRKKTHPVSDWKNKKDHPVVNVSWYEATQYCKWFNETFKSELGDLLLRLPTEAEWEKAARGSYGNEWPWGNEFDPIKCNSRESGKGDTTPVDSYSSLGGDSPYGCADMVGNVWEWTHSLYTKYPYDAKDGREDESSRDKRVLRGGSFDYYRYHARCAYRSYPSPAYRSDPISFRVGVFPMKSL